jgi:hypothetical protein
MSNFLSGILTNINLFVRIRLFTVHVLSEVIVLLGIFDYLKGFDVISLTQFFQSLAVSIYHTSVKGLYLYD